MGVGKRRDPKREQELSPRSESSDAARSPSKPRGEASEMLRENRTHDFHRRI